MGDQPTTQERRASTRTGERAKEIGQGKEREGVAGEEHEEREEQRCGGRREESVTVRETPAVEGTGFEVLETLHTTRSRPCQATST